MVPSPLEVLCSLKPMRNVAPNVLIHHGGLQYDNTFLRYLKAQCFSDVSLVAARYDRLYIVYVSKTSKHLEQWLSSIAFVQRFEHNTDMFKSCE
jgi:hypothetical protein